MEAERERQMETERDSINKREREKKEKRERVRRRKKETYCETVRMSETCRAVIMPNYQTDNDDDHGYLR